MKLLSCHKGERRNLSRTPSYVLCWTHRPDCFGIRRGDVWAEHDFRFSPDRAERTGFNKWLESQWHKDEDDAGRKNDRCQKLTGQHHLENWRAIIEERGFYRLSSAEDYSKRALWKRAKEEGRGRMCFESSRTRDSLTILYLLSLCTPTS